MKVVVIGGGIAGVSVAYALAVDHANRGAALDLIVVEAEQGLAYHTTGRSAALYLKTYGDDQSRALAASSFDFLDNPPHQYCNHAILSPRGRLDVADADHEELFESQLQTSQQLDPTVEEVDIDQALEIFPPLRPRRFVRAMFEPNSADIDVAGLHQTYVRGIRALGGRLTTSFRVDAVQRPTGEAGLGKGKAWVVEAGAGRIGADVVVNAAGAWGDVVAKTAGVEPIGLTPMRRTAFMVGCDEQGMGNWPHAGPVQHSWYAKPDGPQLLCSPANEDPMPPCDVKPVEVDIAKAIEVINADTTLNIRSVNSAWAGLRTFTPDRGLAIGPDPDHDDFFWSVGQGGVGIQTSPAAGRFLAELITTGTTGDWVDEYGIDSAALDPARFRTDS